MDKKMNFEESLARLDKIVTMLEKGEIGLDTSISLFEEGIKLIKECDNKLKEVENSIEKIVENNNK